MLTEMFRARRLLLVQIGALVLLYAAGTYVRLAPLPSWGVYVTADDPVLHVRVTEYVLEHGHLPRNDTLAWYPWGQNWEKTLPNFRYYLTAFLYSIGRSLGMGLSMYDFCVLFPAFFGPLAVLPMFLLVRLLRGWKAGLVSAGVLVLSNGYLSRTIAGFYRHEQVGIPLLILCMYFFVKSTRSARLRDNLAYSLGSGAALVLLTGTWSGFRFLLDGYPVLVFFALLVGRMDRRLLITFVVTDGMALASTFLWPNLSFYFPATFEFTVALVVIITALAHEFVLKKRFDPKRLPTVTIGLAAVIFLVMLTTISGLPSGRLELVVNPLRTAPAGDVSQTVAEHADMQLTFVGGKMDWPALSSYGLFLFLVPLGMVLPFLKREDGNLIVLSMLVFTCFLLFLALDPYPALVCYVIVLLGMAGLWFVCPPDDRPNNEEVMMVLFALLSAYFFKNMIRLNILFSVFVGIQSGLFFGLALDLASVRIRDEAARREGESRSRKRRERRRRERAARIEPEAQAIRGGTDYLQLAMGGVFIILLVWTMSASYRSSKGYPLGLREDWFQALDWLKENTTVNDVIMSWWDYGYWIQTYAGRPTIADGATTNSSQIRRLARAFMTTEKEAYEFCKEFDVRYVVVDVTDDFYPGAKWTAMAVIAEQPIADYMGTDENGNPLIKDKGARCLLFRLASRVALSQPLTLEHFQYRQAFQSSRGQRVIIYEFEL